MKITDVTVKRYSASSDPAAYGGGIQIVEVQTDAGVTGTGFVSTTPATSDLLSMVIRRHLRGVVLGGDPRLTADLWRRMYEDAVPRRGGDGIVRMGIAAVDVVQPNAAITGGITDWLRIHALATLASVPVSPWNLQSIHIHLAAGLPNVKWIEYFMADNPLLEFQGRLFAGPVLREERTADGVFLVPPDGPGLGLALDESVAASSVVRE